MKYQHGGDIYSQEIQLDYSANINPFGLPEGVKEELIRCMDSDLCSIYPDSQCGVLRAALSVFHGLPKQWIICGNGAADLIFGLASALKPGHGLVTAPSFSEYEQALRTAGCQVDYYVLKEEDGFVLDTEGMCSHILHMEEEGHPYDVVFLCNPNNPTGIPVKREEVETLARVCARAGAVLVVDECFCDFLDRPERYSVIPVLDRYPNLFVLKAFTKLYAMAGLRLGYGLGSDGDLLEGLGQARQPWSVSGLAQRAGVKALEEEAYVKRSRDILGRERMWLSRALEDMGLRVYPSQANYIFFRDCREAGRPAMGQVRGQERNWSQEPNPERDQGQLYHALLKRRVLIRSCANYPGLDRSYYRICVKLREENEQLVYHIKQALEQD